MLHKTISSYIQINYSIPQSLIHKVIISIYKLIYLKHILIRKKIFKVNKKNIFILQFFDTGNPNIENNACKI